MSFLFDFFLTKGKEKNQIEMTSLQNLSKNYFL